MFRLRPKHTLESVARELVEGLDDGSIVLDGPGPGEPSSEVVQLAQQIGHEVAVRMAAVFDLGTSGGAAFPAERVAQIATAAAVDELSKSVAPPADQGPPA